MLKLDLDKMERAGSLSVRAEVPGDHALWQDADLEFRDGLTVDVTAAGVGSDQIVVRGDLRATLVHRCRRCLDEVEVPFEHEVAILFAPPDELDEDEGGEIKPLVTQGRMLDLGEAVREEVLLVAPKYSVCSEDCQGLCPQCGANLNETDCDCTVETEDPRWDALRALKSD